MTLTNLAKAPFPWFGGKSQAAPLVWQLLGDVPHYCEPFFGSGAVLLGRPHDCNRPYYSESINDKDGFVTNFWRAVHWYPVETAMAASWPVSEADKSARQIALLRWQSAGGLERLAGDAAWCDPVMAGWWAWAICVQIGAFDGRSAWTADPRTGQIYKQPLPRNSGNAREPGVRRTLPHVSDNGQGVNHAGAREPGVSRTLPHLSDDGQGVNRPAAREPGVLDPITPDYGVSALDSIDWGAAFHDLAMPELIRWFRYLSARLRHVRILNGDWSRLVTSGAAWSLPVRQGKGPAGVFLDPPYSAEADRDGRLYAAEDLSVAHVVREWCLRWGGNDKFRIVLAGYDGEHGDALEAAGWRSYEWFQAGHLRGGMGNTNKNGTHQQDRERLWASPHCLTPDNGKAVQEQRSLFDLDDYVEEQEYADDDDD